jgi:hypothetical protein
VSAIVAVKIASLQSPVKPNATRIWTSVVDLLGPYHLNPDRGSLPEKAA